MPDTATATFSRTGTRCVPVIVSVDNDVVTDFDLAPAPAIYPPEIDFPATGMMVTVEFPFPVWLLDTRLDGDKLFLGLDRLDGDDDWADMIVDLDCPVGAAELRVASERGCKVEVQITVTGAEPVGRCGALYECQPMRRK